MNDYIKVDFNLNPFDETEVDILNALLAEEGFESFSNTQHGVEAYIKAEYFNSEIVPRCIGLYDFKSAMKWTPTLIPGKDWNEEWEQNSFKPLTFDNRCIIHSTNYNITDTFEFDIKINPKMAFGTGNHETTSMLIHEIIESDFSGLNILDMGTGTGILAILSSLKGAKEVTGVEIDSFAFDNAKVNVALNYIDNVNIINGDASCLDRFNNSFDVVIANINRNIILNDLHSYVQSLKSGGIMLLSGFYIHDSALIEQEALKFGLSKVYTSSKDDWCMLKLKRS